jgi:hypothetical protein
MRCIADAGASPSEGDLSSTRGRGGCRNLLTGRGIGAMAGSSVCQSLVADLTTEQRQELGALQAAYDDGVLTGGRAMERLVRGQSSP